MSGRLEHGLPPDQQPDEAAFIRMSGLLPPHAIKARHTAQQTPAWALVNSQLVEAELLLQALEQQPREP